MSDSSDRLSELMGANYIQEAAAQLRPIMVSAHGHAGAWSRKQLVRECSMLVYTLETHPEQKFAAFGGIICLRDYGVEGYTFCVTGPKIGRVNLLMEIDMNAGKR